MIISYSWTTLAMLARRKCVTRRDWSEKQIALAKRISEKGDDVDAWSKSPRVHGVRVATVKILSVHAHQPLRELCPQDWEDEGFALLEALQPRSASQIWNGWHEDVALNPHASLTTVRFEFLSIELEGQRMLDVATEVYGEGWMKLAAAIPEAA